VQHTAAGNHQDGRYCRALRIWDDLDFVVFTVAGEERGAMRVSVAAESR